MKRWLSILVIALLCVVAVFALTACGKTNDAPTDPCAISSASMILTGDHLSLKVPNTTTEFSFLNDITVPEGAGYVVARDKYFENVFHAKIAPLSSGDNHFYILVTNGDAMKLYTVTVYRLPLYTARFETSDGTTIASQSVEEGSLVTAPEEYTFASWQLNGGGIVDMPYTANANVRDMTFTAIFKPIDYTITFIIDDVTDTPEPMTVTYGSEFVLPTPPQKQSYVGEWYDGTTKITNGIWIIPRDVTLIAIYTLDTSIYKVSGNTITGLTDAGKTKYTQIVIPSEINGVTITSIGERAFFGCISLTSVTIPDSVTSIGERAFYGCTSLTSVTIPDSVTSIDEFAFQVCTSLTSVTIPDSVTSIGGGAFQGCTNLASITIPDGVTTVGYSAFQGCTNLTSVTIPDSVTTIGSSAFYNCSSLTGITIPNSVTSIGNAVFYGCTSLASITIPDSVISIGNYAFNRCTSLTSVTIPDSVTSIGNYAFIGCTSLTSIEFTDTSDWYRTTSSSNWQNKTGGTLTSVTDASQNVTYFTSTYDDYYWYKK